MDFKETVINQCKDQVHELFLKCEKSHQFDCNHFNELLPALWNAIQVDGINQNEFYSIVEETIPDHKDFEKIQFPFNLKA